MQSGVLVALALVVAALLYRAGYAGPAMPRATATPTAGARFLPLSGVGCVRDAAWDPSSTLIALAGPRDTGCGYTAYSPDIVNIYRARTGTLMRQLHPDLALFTALGLPQPVPVTSPSSPQVCPTTRVCTVFARRTMRKPSEKLRSKEQATSPLQNLRQLSTSITTRHFGVD